MTSSGNTETVPGPSPQSDRALMPDYLRLVALFGIVVVNVQFIAFPISDGFFGATHQGPLDTPAIWLVNGLAYLKTYGLFSFMFGVGLAFQIQSAERRALPFRRLYRNRMIGLALLGLIHGCLFYPGDILLIYAITGSVLYLWRNWTVPRLVRVGAALLMLQVAIGAVFIAVTPTTDADFAEFERQFMVDGTVAELLVFRSVSFAVIAATVLFFQGISALGWFCLGLAAVRSGLIDAPGHPLWARARRLCLLPGVALSLIGATIWQWHDAMLGEIVVVIAAPLATCGFLGLIAWLARPRGPVATRFLAAGGSSLSIYLGQSIVLSTVFSTYGLGLWDAVSPTAAILMALATTVVLIGLLMLWRTRFALGPFEWVLRRITRMGVGPRKDSGIA